VGGALFFSLMYIPGNTGSLAATTAIEPVCCYITASGGWWDGCGVGVVFGF
jgi:hypothetical protein